MGEKIRIVTASDSLYFSCLLALIGSVVRRHELWTYSISVYDLGLSREDKFILKQLPGVDVFEVEKVNPQIIEPIRKHLAGDERMVPGLYSWKPVAVKSELDKYQNVLWMDAGSVATGNLSELWEHIVNEGYLFMGVCSMAYQTPRTLATRLDLSNEFLSKQALNASIMGLSRTIYRDVIRPMYESAKDLTLFMDDGTADGGPTLGRHDQTLFSIVVNQAELTIHTNGRGLLLNTFNGIKVRSIVSELDQMEENTIIYQCRQNGDWNGDMQYIKNIIGI